MPFSGCHGCLVLAAALPARRAVAQVQVGQVQPAQLPDPEPPVRQPGHHQPVPGGGHRFQQHLPGAVGRQLRVPAPLPRRGQRIGRQLTLHMSQEGPLPVSPRRQPGQLQPRTQLRVDAQQRLMQVEALHARRGGRQGALAERAPALTPRLAIRPAPCRAQRRHVALQVLQRHRLRRQRLPFQPAQVIQQQVRISPLGPRPVIAPQEPVRRLVHGPVRMHDRERPAAAIPFHRLHPEIPDDNPARHESPDPPDVPHVPGPAG
jgi:hypothetical protein